MASQSFIPPIPYDWCGWSCDEDRLRVAVLGEGRARQGCAGHRRALGLPLPLQRVAKPDLCRHQRAQARLHQSARVVLADAVEGSLRVASELFDRDAQLCEMRSLVDAWVGIGDGGSVMVRISTHRDRRFR